MAFEEWQPQTSFGCEDFVSYSFFHVVLNINYYILQPSAISISLSIVVMQFINDFPRVIFSKNVFTARRRDGLEL